MTEKKRRFSWGVGVALLYGSFALFMLTIVWFVALEDFHLVDADYYEKGVNYQQQIDKANRADALSEKPTFIVNRDEKLIMINFPDDLVGDDLTGTITLYNPTNDEYDITLPISLDSSNKQWIPFATLPAGNWKLRIDWSVHTTSYYIEETIYLDTGTK